MGFVQTLGAIIGGLSGLISILIVVFYGGAAIEKLRTLDLRVTDLEQHAAPVTREFMKASAMRDDQMEGRITKLEDLKTAVFEVKTDTKINGLKMDEIVKTTDRLEKAVDELKQRKP